jgi:hypothetical protein
MTLREVRDSLSNLVLAWSKDVQRCSDALVLFLDSLFHRVGELACATWPCAAKDSPLADDANSIERITIAGNNNMDHDQISFSCLRTLMNTFFMLYRLIHWMGMADNEDDDCNGNIDVSIHHHHVSASQDTFYKLGMYYDLPPSARLNYRHMFSGLYNCISQPVYYHNPDYERRTQVPLVRIRERERERERQMPFFPQI